jgi:hypothetical protein
MEKPKINKKLTLLTDSGTAEAICTEIRDDPATDGGVLIKVMARGPFEEGQQLWIVDRGWLQNRSDGRERFRTDDRRRTDAFDRSAGLTGADR